MLENQGLAKYLIESNYFRLCLCRAISDTIGEAFAGNALERIARTHFIVHAECNAVVVTKIKFREIAMVNRALTSPPLWY